MLSNVVNAGWVSHSPFFVPLDIATLLSSNSISISCAALVAGFPFTKFVLLTLNNLYLYGGGVHYERLNKVLKKELNIASMDLNALLDVNNDTFTALGVIEDVK